MIRTLIADDSRAFREALIAVLREDAAFEVVGSAAGGEEAVDLARKLRPDLIIIDVQMPGMSGVSATAEIMSEAPCAVVVMSALMASQGTQVAFEALRAGAVEAIGKPKDLHTPSNRANLRALLKAMAEVKVVRRRRGHSGQHVSPGAAGSTARPSKIGVVAIGASTGGPPALREVLRHLPRSFPAPVVVAQHLAHGFAEGLRQWFSDNLALEVELVSRPVALRAGCVYLAADGHDLFFQDGQLRGTIVNGPAAVPSVDRLFDSLLEFGERAVGVVLTGMGRDGAEGLRRLRERGARTAAQDARTSLIDGMPKAARDLDAAEVELGLPEIGPWLCAVSGVLAVGARGASSSPMPRVAP